MTERGQDPIADMINLFAAPIAGGLRTVEQMRKGVDELFRAVENLNRTLENMNATTERVNRLLAEIEGPVMALMPQLTRTIQTADYITQQLETPVRTAAPNLERMADTFGSPAFAQLPSQMTEFMKQMNTISRNMNPLVQLAENAGGLFGGLRFPGMGGSSQNDDKTERPATETSPTRQRSTTTGSSTKKPAAKKSAAKKTGAKRSTAKKQTEKRASATRASKRPNAD